VKREKGKSGLAGPAWLAGPARLIGHLFFASSRLSEKY